MQDEFVVHVVQSEQDLHEEVKDGVLVQEGITALLDVLSQSPTCRRRIWEMDAKNKDGASNHNSAEVTGSEETRRSKLIINEMSRILKQSRSPCLRETRSRK